MDRDDILAEDIMHDEDIDRMAEADEAAARAEAFAALVREDYEPNPYDGTC